MLFTGDVLAALLCSIVLIDWPPLTSLEIICRLLAMTFVAELLCCLSKDCSWGVHLICSCRNHRHSPSPRLCTPPFKRPAPFGTTQWFHCGNEDYSSLPVLDVRECSLTAVELHHRRRWLPLLLQPFKYYSFGVDRSYFTRSFPSICHLHINYVQHVRVLLSCILC